MISGRVDLDGILRQVNCYHNVARVRADVIACIAQVRTLIPKKERLIHNNGMESELLVLHGTVAINYQGRQYNIPVEVYVSEPYPEAPPRCYVRPTKDMDIKVGHRHVDREGLVYLPYLHEWTARSHNLTELCAAMSSVFGMDPPVYAIKKPGTGSASPTPVAVATAASFSTSLYPGQVGGGGGGSGRYTPVGQQVQQPSPPPSYSSVTTPVQEEQYQAEAKKREAMQQVLSKTQRALKAFYGKVTTELGEEQEKEAALQAHRKEVQASLGAMKKKKEEVEERIRRVMEMDGRLEKWMAEQASRPVIPVDDLVEAADPPSRQMLELVAENAAIEDALYHLDKALAKNSVDLQVFLKKVRELAREQLMCVAHVNKIYRAQQAALVAARAAPLQNRAVGAGRGGGGGSIAYPSIPPAMSR